MKKIVLMGLLIVGMSLGFTGCKQSDSLTSSDISFLTSKSEKSAKNAQCLTGTISGYSGVSAYELRGEQQYRYKGKLGLSSSGVQVKNVWNTTVGYRCFAGVFTSKPFQKGMLYPGQTISCLRPANSAVSFESCSSWKF